MSEFMLILPATGGADPNQRADLSDPAEIIKQMELCLAALDSHDASLAAAHLAMAIHQAKFQFKLNGDGSKTD